MSRSRVGRVKLRVRQIEMFLYKIHKKRVLLDNAEIGGRKELQQLNSIVREVESRLKETK